MKKTIDIEKLLHWAIRDELPKGQAVAASPWDIITQYCALGVRVQTSGFGGDGYGFTPGAPHEDAIIVGDTVRALATEARFDDLAEVLPLFGDLVGIAGDAVQSIMVASFDPRSLVISNATMGTRPKWQFGQPSALQMFTEFHGKDGAVRERPLVHGVDGAGDVVAMLPNRGRAVKRDGMYSYAYAPRSPLNWQCPAMVHVGDCRAEYVAWHAALVALAGDLADRLAAFTVLPPAATPMPWLTGQAPASRVLPGHDFSDDAAAALAYSFTARRDPARRPLGGPRASSVRFVDPAGFEPQPTSKTVAPVG